MWRLALHLRYINCYPEDGLDGRKHAKTLSHFFKKMVINRYANHMLSIFNCMPQHYATTMHCYKTIYYKRYTKYEYNLFISTLSYWITPKYEITLTVKCPKMEIETVCKFRSNMKDTCILKTIKTFQGNVNQNKTLLLGSTYSNRNRNTTLPSKTA
jgi:hypothetical protein